MRIKEALDYLNHAISYTVLVRACNQLPGLARKCRGGWDIDRDALDRAFMGKTQFDAGVSTIRPTPKAASPYYYLSTRVFGNSQKTMDYAALRAQMLLRAGIPVFSSVIQNQYIGEAMGTSDLSVHNRPLLEASRGMIIIQDDGWAGDQEEIKLAKSYKKYIYFSDPLMIDTIQHICAYYPKRNNIMTRRREAALLGCYAVRNRHITQEEFSSILLNGNFSDALVTRVSSAVG